LMQKVAKRSRLHNRSAYAALPTHGNSHFTSISFTIVCQALIDGNTAGAGIAPLII
jgi:hypothetical protein